MKIANWNDVDDETKIVRFVDYSGAMKSLGDIDDGVRSYTFPINLLSHYKNAEDNRGDKQEGETKIHINDTVAGRASHSNTSLISCWSFWDEKTSPWESLKGSSFVDDKKNTHVLVSSVGDVKSEFNKINAELNLKYVSERGEPFLFSSYCGAVNYYNEQGVDVDEYNDQTNGARGCGVAMIYQIYNKPRNRNDGQSFSAEKECRFSIILNDIITFKDPETGKYDEIKTIAKKLSYYSMKQENTDPHYVHDLIEIPR